MTTLLQIMLPGASMKAKKGKKQETIRSDLAHILGYTGTDMDPVGPPSPVGSEKEAAGMQTCSSLCIAVAPVASLCAAFSCWCKH